MQIRLVTASDILAWMELSAEHDQYVLELVPDLTEWYEGDGESSPAYDDYMQFKISKNEAYMAVSPNGYCLGVAAVSRI